MKKISCFLLLSLSFHFGFTQDIIYKKNGDKIEANVLEVGVDEVKYKKFNVEEGPIYVLLKSDLFMIEYGDGSRDVFNADNQTSEKEAGTPVQKQSKDLHKSSLSFNLLGLLQFGPIIQYETRISENLYLVPHLRIGYAGALTHIIWGSHGGTVIDPAIGAGLGIRSFSPVKNSNGAWYYSGHMELHYTTAQYERGDNERYFQVGVFGNAGYRWRYKKGGFLNVGGILGAGYGFSNYTNSVQPIFMAEVTYGFEF